MKTHTSLITRNTAVRPPLWFPPAPERTAQPVVIISETTAQRTSTDAMHAELLAARAEIKQLQASLAYYRSKAAKPMVERTRETWLSRALCGQAQASPMPAVATLTEDLYETRKCGTLPIKRA